MEKNCDTCDHNLKDDIGNCFYCDEFQNWKAIKTCDTCNWHEIGWDFPCTECVEHSRWEPEDEVA